MRSFVSGADVSVEIPFFQLGDYVVPDAGSVSYTLRDNSGNPVAGQTDVAVAGPYSTSAVITIAASYNGKALDFEYRTIVVSYKVSGQLYVVNVGYRLIDFITMAVDENSVRSLIGFAPDELPNDDIDLPMAYYTAANDIGRSALDTALQSGTVASQAANRAIACQAVLDILPSLQMRVMQAQQSQTAQARRISRIDITALTNYLSNLYSKAKVVITGAADSSYLPIIVGTPTDPVTGV